MWRPLSKTVKMNNTVIRWIKDKPGGGTDPDPAGGKPVTVGAAESKTMGNWLGNRISYSEKVCRSYLSTSLRDDQPVPTRSA